MKEETLQKETRFDGRVFRVEEQRVRLPDGTTARREIVYHDGGAAVVALDEQQRVILVRQYRPAAGRTMLEIPAGRLEPGETPAACAQRELAEETGYRALAIHQLTSFYPTPGYCSERLHLFFTTQIQSGPSAPDAGEFVTTERVPLAVCLEDIDHGRIEDGKTIIGILLAAARLSDDVRVGNEKRGDGGV